MSTFRLPRHSDVDLEFEGELLAEASTRRPDKVRWQDVLLYRTESGRWIVQRIGRSSVPRETDLSDVTVCDSPEQVRLALSDTERDDHGGQRRYLTWTAEKALRAAAAADPGLGEALIERV